MLIHFPSAGKIIRRSRLGRISARFISKVNCTHETTLELSVYRQRFFSIAVLLSTNMFKISHRKRNVIIMFPYANLRFQALMNGIFGWFIAARGAQLVFFQPKNKRIIGPGVYFSALCIHSIPLMIYLLAPLTEQRMITKVCSQVTTFSFE